MKTLEHNCRWVANRVRLCRVLLGLVPWLAGCVTTAPVETGPALGPAAACHALFRHMDGITARSGLGDADYARIQGFPWLRTNRFLASFEPELEDEERLVTWLGRANAMDREVRLAELAWLDRGARLELGRAWSRLQPGTGLPVTPAEALENCRTLLDGQLLAQPDRVAELRRQIDVPDAYRTWLRVAGLYPIAAALARPRILALHQRLEALQDSEPAGDLAVFASAGAGAARTATASGLLAKAPRDALGIPVLEPGVLELLKNAWAPRWAIEQHSEADRPGMLMLDTLDRPFVAGWHPVEYRDLGFTRMGDEILVQLSYTIWFPERPAAGPLDIYAGLLAGVTWRVTLDGQGGLRAFDSVHACGCYYMLQPGPGWQARSQPRSAEPLFAPGPAVPPPSGERVELRLQAGTHYLAGTRIVPDSRAARSLHPLPASSLRRLHRVVLGYRSAYAPDGLMPVSRRPERFLLWPFGIPSAGAQRQPGTQAIAFIGRRHFDDARLFEGLLEPGR
ncbi:MAG: hypothetical protein JJT85_09020 [Chromatiales bacterium]|nr:hypothetical protein [Chromatiales bacterium]